MNRFLVPCTYGVRIRPYYCQFADFDHVGIQQKDEAEFRHQPTIDAVKRSWPRVRQVLLELLKPPTHPAASIKAFESRSSLLWRQIFNRLHSERTTPYLISLATTANSWNTMPQSPGL